MSIIKKSNIGYSTRQDKPVSVDYNADNLEQHRQLFRSVEQLWNKTTDLSNTKAGGGDSNSSFITPGATGHRHYRVWDSDLVTVAIEVDSTNNTTLSGNLAMGGNEITNASLLTVRDVGVAPPAITPYYGISNVQVVRDAGNSTEASDVFGIFSQTWMDDVDEVIGFLYGADIHAILTRGTIGDGDENLIGARFTAEISGGTALRDVYGIYSLSDCNYGTIGDDVFGISSRVDIEASVTSIAGDVFGMYIWMDVDKDPDGDVYALYIKDDMTGVDYGVFQVGTSPNVLNGSLTLGGNLAMGGNSITGTDITDGYLPYSNSGTLEDSNIYRSGSGVGLNTTTLNETFVLYKGDSTSNYIQIGNSTTTIADDNGFYVGIDASENARLINRENTSMYFETNDVVALEINNSQSVVLDVGDLYLDHDGAVIYWGEDADITLTHTHNIGLGINGHLGVNTAADDRYGIYFLNATVNTAKRYYGSYAWITKTAGATDTSDNMIGMYSRFILNQSGGTVGHQYGILGECNVTDGGVGDVSTSRNVIGMNGFIQQDGGKVWGKSVGVYAYIDQNAGSENTGPLYGLWVNVDADGTNADSVYMAYFTEASNIDYCIYQDGSAPSRLAGHLQIDADDKYVYWGAAQDCGITYGGSNMEFYANLVGTGFFNFVDGGIRVNTSESDADTFIYGTDSVEPIMHFDAANNSIGIGNRISGDDKVRIAYAPSNDSGATCLFLDYDATHTDNNTYSYICLNIDVDQTGGAGFKNSGYIYGIRNITFGGPGNLANMRAINVQFGNDTGDTGTIDDVRGLSLSPYGTAGTITTRYDLYIAAATAGGTVTNDYCIYSDHDAPSYLVGQLGIREEATAGYLLDVKDSTLNITTHFRGINSAHTKTAGATTEADDLHAGFFYMEMDDGDSTVGHVRGVYSLAVVTAGTVGDGNEDAIGGLFSSNIDGGTVTGDSYGSYDRVLMQGGTVSTDIYGTYSLCDLNTGTVTGNVYGTKITVDVEAGFTSIGGDVYGLYVFADLDTDPTGTAYMIYMDDNSNVDYCIYQENGVAISHFGGHVCLPDDTRINFGNTDAAPDAYIEHDTSATPDELIMENTVVGENIHIKTAQSGSIILEPGVEDAVGGDQKLYIGSASNNADVYVYYQGTTNTGLMYWREDEDYFEFADDLLMASDEKIQFRDTAIYIHSRTDGYLTLEADNRVEVTALLETNGAVICGGDTYPSASDGGALGTASREWSDLYLADGAIINLGDDQDVTLTHVADTGVLLNSNMQLQFRDSAIHIASLTDGHLDLTADTIVDINADTLIDGALGIDQPVNSGWDYDEVIEINNQAAWHTTATQSFFVRNAYRATGGQWKYMATDEAEAMFLSDGATYFYYADSAAADSNLTFTEIGSFDSDGLKCASNRTIHARAQTGAPSTTTEGALWLDTDAGGNGHLMCYANGGWRTVATL